MKYKRILYLLCLSLLLISGCQALPDATQTVEIAGEDIFFDVIDIEAVVGQDITIVYTNKGQLQHNFVLEVFDIETNVLAPGAQDTFTFNATTPGEFVYYCSVPGHETLMHGKLIINGN